MDNNISEGSSIKPSTKEVDSRWVGTRVVKCDVMDCGVILRRFVFVFSFVVVLVFLLFFVAYAYQISKG